MKSKGRIMIVARIPLCLLIAFIVASCATNVAGVGGSKPADGVNVLRLSYEEALDLAFKIGKENFTDVERTDRGSVIIYNQNIVRGNTLVEVTPQIVVNLDDQDDTGITYRLKAAPYGINFSLNPGYINGIFLARVAEKRKVGEVESATFVNYMFTNDLAVAERIPDSIPVGYGGFKRYLDNKKNRAAFEGIWTDPDGKYTLGLLKDTRDPRYQYKAFVIESRARNWEPGQVKFKVNQLSVGGIAIGPYHYANKADSGVTWKVDKGLLLGVNDTKLAFFMIYPDNFGGGSTEVEITGAGTGWAVTADGYFVTNAHVVEGAKKIYIGFREGSPKRARVVAIDARTDLAVLKIGKPDRRYTPLSVSIARAVPNGTAITVIGYPLAFTLGDDPRVTDGIISAQSGYEKDVTRYQISAPVQPGNSGGPVIGPDGRVAAVVVSGLRGDTQNVNFAIKMAYLRTLLDGAGVRYNTAANAGMSSAQIFKAYRDSILPVWTER